VQRRLPLGRELRDRISISPNSGLDKLNQNARCFYVSLSKEQAEALSGFNDNMTADYRHLLITQSLVLSTFSVNSH